MVVQPDWPFKRGMIWVRRALSKIPIMRKVTHSSVQVLSKNDVKVASTKGGNWRSGPCKKKWKIPALQHVRMCVFLVGATSTRRVSELAAFFVAKELCIYSEDRVTLRLDPSFLRNVNTIFHHSEEVVLPPFCPNPVYPREKR